MGGESVKRMGVHFPVLSERLQENPLVTGASRRGAWPSVRLLLSCRTWAARSPEPRSVQGVRVVRAPWQERAAARCPPFPVWQGSEWAFPLGQEAMLEGSEAASHLGGSPSRRVPACGRHHMQRPWAACGSCGELHPRSAKCNRPQQ